MFHVQPYSLTLFNYKTYSVTHNGIDIGGARPSMCKCYLEVHTHIYTKAQWKTLHHHFAHSLEVWVGKICCTCTTGCRKQVFCKCGWSGEMPGTCTVHRERRVPESVHSIHTIQGTQRCAQAGQKGTVRQMWAFPAGELFPSSLENEMKLLGSLPRLNCASQKSFPAQSNFPIHRPNLL